MSLCNIFAMQTIYVDLKEIWLLERDPDARSAYSEPGGK